MVRNPIQEKRIRRYFLDATKEILISEGVSALSVRNVSEKAGYSYATLYNYFKNLSQLLAESIIDFQEDCAEYITEKIEKSNSKEPKTHQILKAYVEYLVQSPSLYNLFYTTEIGNQTVNHSTILFPEQLCDVELKRYLDSNTYNSTQVEEIKQRIRVVIPGILLVYIGKEFPKDYKEFIRMMNQHISLIFNFNNH